MKTVTKDLVNMAKAAGLEVLGHHRESSSYCIETRAPNGVERTFRLKESGSRADVDLQTRIRRFARENPAPDALPMPVEIPKPAPEAAPVKPVVQIKPKRTIVKVAAEKPATAPATTAAPAALATQELTTTELYRLCEWTKQQALAQFPSLEALALSASSKIGRTVSEQSMREVMAATETAEPEHWTPLPDPHIVVARELAAFMAELNVKPSTQFSRLMEALA